MSPAPSVATQNGRGGGNNGRRRFRSSKPTNNDQNDNVKHDEQRSNAQHAGNNTAPVRGQRPAGLTRNEHEALKRRSRRAKLRARKLTCFHCRTRGHSVQECPRLNGVDAKEGTVAAGPQASGICYRCGSLEHTLSRCSRPAPREGPTLPFAECFVCGARGHLASQCSSNERGVYPDGGSCRFCGSVRHLARDCAQAPSRGGGSKTVEVFAVAATGTEGGDDDDMPLDLAVGSGATSHATNVVDDVDVAKGMNNTAGGLFAAVVAEKSAPTTTTSAAAAARKRRVVTF